MTNAGKMVRLSGPERAAILMMSLGEKEASQVVKHMRPREVQKLAEVVSSMAGVSREQMGHVLRAFSEVLDTPALPAAGSEEHLRRILMSALGEDKASGITNRVQASGSSKGLEALKWMAPRAVAEIVRAEHPQIAAVLVSHLDSDQAAEVLSLLPENIRADILMRVASLDGIQPSALRELDEALEEEFSRISGNLRSFSVGGTKAAVDILRLMESSGEGDILDRVKDLDPELGQSIDDVMFTFDDLTDVDGRSMQALLREISSDTLVTALKGAGETVREKIFMNLSKRAGEVLHGDLEARGPVRLSDVKAAQKEILTIARRMAEGGDFSFGNRGDELA